MTYTECVANAAISIFSSRQIAGPQAAIDLAETLADQLKQAGYLDKEPESEPVLERKPKKKPRGHTPDNKPA